MNITIREIKPSEYYLLEQFLYEAIFQKDNDEQLPKEIIKEPELHVYIESFGKKSDFGLVAEVNSKVVGCVWTRILSGKVKGFGNIDEQTPEFAISVLKEYRGNGIGYLLMSDMLKLLKEKGFHQVSLAVQKENYAANLYKKVGFEIIKEKEEEYVMIRKL